MLSGWYQRSFNDGFRGEDRHALLEGVRGASDKPPILRRWTIQAIAVFGILGITYGTLAPFQFDFSKTLSWRLHWHELVPSDAVANVLLYVPIGLFFRLLVRRRGSVAAMEWTASLLLAAGLSYLTEVFQTVLAFRVASWFDVICNAAGAGVGILLAPTFQRLVRNQHAWLYHELRRHPFNAGSAVLGIAVLGAGLMPFDVHPSAGHVAQAFVFIKQATFSLPWNSPVNPAIALTPVELYDKFVAAGSYALLAMMLTLAAREARRDVESALRYALTRSLAIVAAIEVLQVFTISHVADPRDLLLGWAFCGIGVAFTGCWFRRLNTALPRPVLVLRGVVIVALLAVLGRALAYFLLRNGGTAPVMACWLPMASGFHRPWAALLAEYMMSTVRYGLLASALVLWSRANHQVPSALWLVGLTVMAALMGQAISLLRWNTIETAELILALAAAIAVLRADAAIFGTRRAVPAHAR